MPNKGARDLLVGRILLLAGATLALSGPAVAAPSESAAFPASPEVLRQIKPSIEEAAINLGASPVKAFWKVTVPLMVPGIIAMVGYMIVVKIVVTLKPEAGPAGPRVADRRHRAGDTDHQERDRDGLLGR